MAGEILTVALSLAAQVGAPGPSETPNAPPLQNAYNQYGFEGQFEQRHAFDTQQNWVHGYFQEIPAYGGHVFFRPYNYKDVLSQSQTAAGWGLSPTMPYSQQFWHRYHDQAAMLKLSRTNTQPTMMTPAPATVSPVFTAPTGVLPASAQQAQPPAQTPQVPPTFATTPFSPPPGYYLVPAPVMVDPALAPPLSSIIIPSTTLPSGSTGPVFPPR